MAHALLYLNACKNVTCSISAYAKNATCSISAYAKNVIDTQNAVRSAESQRWTMKGTIFTIFHEITRKDVEKRNGRGCATTSETKAINL
eukprot:scaffold1138_cov25-Tisochrysis_lutea.AAC.1